MTRYFFAPETGSDSNSGLTSGAPKQTPGAATALVLAGNQISWKRGERYHFTSAGSDGWRLQLKQLASECIIDTYGSGDKPLFDALVYLESGVDDSNWTFIGNGQWTRTFSAEVGRLWSGTTVASVRADSMGQPFGYVSSAAAVTSELKWHITSAAPWVATVYTGGSSAAHNPPTWYDGLVTSGNGIATASVITLSRCDNITFDSIRLAGGFRRGIFALAESSTSFSNIILRDCEVRAVGRLGSGISFSNSSVDTAATGFQIIRPLVDGMSNASEDDGDSGRWSAQNGISLNGGVEDIVVVDPILRGGLRHSYFQAQCDGTTTKRICRNVHVYRSSAGIAEINGFDSNYCHSIDTDAEGWLIEGITVRYQSSRSQFGGTGKLAACFFYDTKEATHPENLTGGQVLWVQNWTSPDRRAVNDVTFENILISNPHSHPVAILEDRSAAGVSSDCGFATDAVKINFCTIVDLDNLGSRTACVDHQVQGTPFVNSGLILQDNKIVTTLSDVLRRETAAGVNTLYTENAYSGASRNVKYASLSAADLNATTFLPNPKPIGRSARRGRPRPGSGKLR